MTFLAAAGIFIGGMVVGGVIVYGAVLYYIGRGFG